MIELVDVRLDHPAVARRSVSERQPRGRVRRGRGDRRRRRRRHVAPRRGRARRGAARVRSHRGARARRRQAPALVAAPAAPPHRHRAAGPVPDRGPQRAAQRRCCRSRSMACRARSRSCARTSCLDPARPRVRGVAAGRLPAEPPCGSASPSRARWSASPSSSSPITRRACRTPPAPSSCASAFAEAAAAGAAVVAFARDHAMRAIAEARGWRQLAPHRRPAPAAVGDRARRPDDRGAARGARVRATSRRRDAADESIPNIVPFPITARTAGVA